MPQQINLADPRLLPKTVPFGARHALLGMAAVLAIGAAASSALNVMAGRIARDVARAAPPPAQAGVAPRAAHANDAAAVAAEIERLRAAEAGQRRIRAALDAGVAGEREGHAGYFVALARQAQASVWITGFAVSEDGSALDLEGRMTAPHALPAYLRRLNAEPRFRGRPFEQLNLRAAEAAAAQPYTEFALRSKPAAVKAP